MELERRTFAVAELRAVEDDGKKKIRGHAAVFNELSEDLGGFREQIAPGAFTEAVKEDDVRALWNHDPNFVLGRNKSGTLKLTEDEQGLAIEVEPPDTQWARDLLVSIDRGDVSQMSFGFSVKPNGQNWGEDNDGNIVRTLTGLRLYDVSPVTFPAYPSTDVAVRSMGDWKQQQGTPVHSIDRLRKNLELIEIEVGKH